MDRRDLEAKAAQEAAKAEAAETNRVIAEQAKAQRAAQKGIEANRAKSASVAAAPSSAVINGESAPVWDPQHPAADFARGACGEHLQGTTEPAIPKGNHNAAPKDKDKTDPKVRTHNEADAK